MDTRDFWARIRWDRRGHDVSDSLGATGAENLQYAQRGP
jgi:hypothetical protein